jgi:hypothetical protein
MALERESGDLNKGVEGGYGGWLKMTISPFKVRPMK